MSKLTNKMQKHFTQLPNAIILDKTLSDGAFRVFAYIAGKPDGWIINNRDVQHNLDIKRKETMAKYWRELIESGWITRQPLLNDIGNPSGYYDYDLNIIPVKPSTEKPYHPSTEKPDTVNAEVRKNRTLNNKELDNNKETTNIITPKGAEKQHPGFTISFSETAQEAAWNAWLDCIEKNHYEFTYYELDAIKAYAYAKPNQPIHVIMSNLSLFDKWINEGLDIENALRQSLTTKAIIKPQMRIARDSVSNRIYNIDKLLAMRQNEIKQDFARIKELKQTGDK